MPGDLWFRAATRYKGKDNVLSVAPRSPQSPDPACISQSVDQGSPGRKIPESLYCHTSRGKEQTTSPKANLKKTELAPKERKAPIVEEKKKQPKPSDIEERIKKREEMLQQEWNRYADTLISHSAASLTDDEKGR